MARLIVVAGGTTRRFKLGDGKLTLGSGEEANLTLESEDLAEVHADLEVSGDTVTVATRKGTTGATVGGRRASGPVQIGPGKSVSIGDVKISIEGDAPAAPAKTGSARAGAKPAAAKAGSGRASAGRASAGRASAGPASAPRPARADSPAARPRVERHAVERKEGLPSWLIVLGILVVAGVGFLLFRSQVDSMDEEGFSAKASHVRLEGLMREGDFLGADRELKKVRGHWNELDQSYKTIFEAYEKDIEKDTQRATELERNSQGDPYWNTQLSKYVDRYLDPPNRPAARVFIKRIDWFMQEYPLHNKLQWCTDYRARWAGLAAMNEPNTYDDMAFEVKSLTHAMPRDYKLAFQVLDEFSLRAEGSHKAMAETLRAELVTARQEYHLDRMQQAEYYFKSNEKGKAVSWLTQSVIKLGDVAMENEAAEILVALPGVESAIQGYCNQQQDIFEALKRNKVVAAFISQHDIKPQN